MDVRPLGRRVLLYLFCGLGDASGFAPLRCVRGAGECDGFGDGSSELRLSPSGEGRVDAGGAAAGLLPGYAALGG